MKTTFRQAALAAAFLAATAGAAAAQTAMRVTVTHASGGGAPVVTTTPLAGAPAAATTSKETVIAAVNQYFPHLPAHLEHPLTFVVGADGKVVSAERSPARANEHVQPSAIGQMEVFKGERGGIQVHGRYVDVIWITLKA
ncbi:MAG: hypothetical protein JWM27_1296 [Gemmatimonadetes bacterium]|nr:hypothetical protein [Gemmatimonadota bacterium]